MLKMLLELQRTGFYILMQVAYFIFVFILLHFLVDKLIFALEIYQSINLQYIY